MAEALWDDVAAAYERSFATLCAGTTEALEQWSGDMPAHNFHITPTTPSTQGRGHSHRQRMHHDTPVRHGQPVSTP